MIEKNRNILSDAINKMPVRKPRASGWSAVSGGLDQLNLETILSSGASKLPRHKAPAGAWSKIAAGLPPTAAPFFSTLIGKLFLGSLIAGGLIIAYLLFLVPEENEIIAQKQESKAPLVIESSSPSPQSNSNEQATSTSPPVLNEETTPPHTESIEADVAIHDQPQQIVALPTPHAANVHEPLIETIELNILTPIESSLLETDILQKTLPEKELITPEKFDHIEYAKDMTKAEFKAGVFYAFKRYQKIEEEGMDIPQNQSSVGLELVYEKDKWFFKTGIAYVSWKEKGDYTYDYDQNQLVYQYNYVDSTFINPMSGGITYYTTETFVYDSVAGQQHDQASYDYQMLQIPLIAGYKLLSRKNFNIGVLGGVGFDIRLSGKQFIPAFNQDGSTINEVNSSLKYRTTNNWRLLGGLELGYIFAQKWELYTEPSYQWYMKPLYSPENTKGIGLFNIKAGLRYIF